MTHLFRVGANLEPDGLRPTLMRLSRTGGRIGTAIADGIDEFVTADPFRALIVVVSGLLLVTVLKGLVTFAHDYLVTATCQRAQLDLAEDLFDRLTEQDETTLSGCPTSPPASATTWTSAARPWARSWER